MGAGQPGYYAVTLLVGLVVSAVVWSRIGRPRYEMMLVYVCGLLGALVGAHVLFIAAELAFRVETMGLLRGMMGRTILGGLLGGYAGVEAGKKLIGHREATGDFFAVAVPAGLFWGRVGCYLQGCCLGRECGEAWYAAADSEGVLRYPATLVEAVFEVVAAVVMYWCFRRKVMAGQLFHVYLMGYGVFRFGVEYVRETPRVGGVVSVYQVIAVGLVGFAAWRYATRARERRLAADGEILMGEGGAERSVA